jgi:hypothetical protein
MSKADRTNDNRICRICLSTLQSVTILLLLTLITSCQADKPVAPKQVYFSLTPKNLVLAKAASRFLLNAKESTSGNTKIIKTPHIYTVTENCSNNTPDFLVPSLPLTENTRSETVTSEAEKSIAKIVKGEKRCSASSYSLLELPKNFGQATSSGELIIFWQIPWDRSEISDDIIRKFTMQMNGLAKTKKVKKLVLFGLNPQGSDRLLSCFKAFDKGIVSPAVNQGAINSLMITINRELL